MTLSERIAAEALALVGAPFRLHGRCERTGLDCVGLALLAAERAGLRAGPLPAYRMRGTSLTRVEETLRAAGFAPVVRGGAGDILIARSGPMQLHLLIRTGEGIVHADAGLGRVVLMPAPSPWPLLGQWRCVTSKERG